MRQKKAICISVLIAVITFICSYFQILSPLDKRVSDNLCQKASVTNKDIYIIAIDDKTLAKYGPVNTWKRDIPAKLVTLLNEDNTKKPAVIGFDVIYSENVEENTDLLFAETCKEAGNVVLANSFQYKELPVTDQNGNTVFDSFHIESAVLPYDSLKNACHFGYATTIIDKDGCVRRTKTSVQYEGTTVYSFATQIYLDYMKIQGKEPVLPKTDDAGQYYFSYSAKSGGYSVVSMADVLDGTVDSKLFGDAIVLVGAYAVGMQDSYTPAISHNKQMYGVEIHANIIEALLEGKTQTDLPLIGYSVVIAILAGMFFFAIRNLKMISSTIVFVLIAAANFIFAKVIYGQGQIAPVLLFVIILALIYIENLVQSYLEELKRRKRVVSVFKQYVAPQVVEKISKDKDFKIVLEGENRHIAVLFVDIRGFTTMSESLQPEEVVEILNEYLSLTTKSIFDNGGTLDKFVGDATMAVFNAPFDLDDYIYCAVRTAWDMKAGADAIAAKFEVRFGKSVAFGIGINCGDAVVGNIGCDFRMDYTAIGDTVNTAARLESNAKRGQILISEYVYAAVKDRVEVTAIGEIPLKGKNKGVFVYQLDEVR